MVERLRRHAGRVDAREAMGGGAIAGFIAGLVFWLVVMILSAAQGGTIWSVMKGAAAPLLSAQALGPQFSLGPVLLGSALHFLISAAWGAAFGVLAYGLSKGATVLAGLGWGVVVWLVMSYLVLPLAGLGQMVAATPAGIAIAAHLIFGLATGVSFLPFQRRIPTTPMGAGRRAALP